MLNASSPDSQVNTLKSYPKSTCTNVVYLHKCRQKYSSVSQLYFIGFILSSFYITVSIEQSLSHFKKLLYVIFRFLSAEIHSEILFTQFIVAEKPFGNHVNISLKICTSEIF